MTDLVPGELRGYRQFDLLGGGLHPLVHGVTGPWDGELERAVCAKGEDHAPPHAACTCGLYAMYRPGSGTISLGAANAVICARGRVVLGDRGFRAASARIEAVALPLTAWHRMPAARRELAQRYPHTRVYRSTRRMLRDHPPHDVSALGIVPPRDRSRGYRTAAVVLWAVFVVAGYGVWLLPRERAADLAATWWPLLVVLVLGVQAGFIWLLSKLMALQLPGERL
jgi:hypothetical protein